MSKTKPAKAVQSKRTVEQSREQAGTHRPGLPPAHIGRAVRNCSCASCRLHRRLNAEALRDRALAALHDLAVGPMTVEVGRNASQALADALQ